MTWCPSIGDRVLIDDDLGDYQRVVRYLPDIASEEALGDEVDDVGSSFIGTVVCILPPVTEEQLQEFYQSVLPHYETVNLEPLFKEHIEELRKRYITNSPWLQERENDEQLSPNPMQDPPTYSLFCIHSDYRNEYGSDIDNYLPWMCPHHHDINSCEVHPNHCPMLPMSCYSVAVWAPSDIKY
jgi:hypothetical protein